MKRKIVKLGTATLVVSLPAKWTKRFNLKQGDELEVQERKKELLLSIEKITSDSRKVMDITGLDTKLVERLIVGAYVSGYDEIKLVFKRPGLKDLKSQREVFAMNLIQSVVNNLLISMEIIEQREDSCILRDLSQIAETSFEPVVRRLFLLLKSMSADCLEYVRTFDKEKMRNITPVRDNITRFINYALRILNKSGAAEANKSFQYYAIISELKNIARVFQYISLEFSHRKKQPLPKVLSAFEEVNRSINIFYELFYKFDHQKAMELVKRRRRFFDLVNKVQSDPKSENDDVLLCSRLAIIIVQLLNLSEIRISIEL